VTITRKSGINLSSRRQQCHLIRTWWYSDQVSTWSSLFYWMERSPSAIWILLIQLHSLDLSKNCLKILPDRMAQLTNLHILYLRSNYLSLPEWMIRNLPLVDMTGAATQAVLDELAGTGWLYILFGIGNSSVITESPFLLILRLLFPRHYACVIQTAWSILFWEMYWLAKCVSNCWLGKEG